MKIIDQLKQLFRKNATKGTCVDFETKFIEMILKDAINFNAIFIFFGKPPNLDQNYKKSPPQLIPDFPLHPRQDNSLDYVLPVRERLFSELEKNMIPVYFENKSSEFLYYTDISWFVLHHLIGEIKLYTIEPEDSMLSSINYDCVKELLSAYSVKIFLGMLKNYQYCIKLEFTH